MKGYEGISSVWGEISFRGITYKDTVITASRVSEWDWTQDSTTHAGGLTVVGLKRYLTPGVRVIYIGTGYHDRVRISTAVKEFCARQHIALTVLPTPVLIPQLASVTSRRHTLSFIHSTC